MLKYTNAKVVFAEVPNEISLAVEISNCPYHCKGCHSKYLWNDIGQELTEQVISELIESNSGITCFCFMGDGGDEAEVIKLAEYINKKYPSLYIGLYTGAETISSKMQNVFDYIKTGPYIEERGPITSRTTNQRMIRINHPRGEVSADWLIMDITDQFWKNDSNT